LVLFEAADVAAAEALVDLFFDLSTAAALFDKELSRCKTGLSLANIWTEFPANGGFVTGNDVTLLVEEKMLFGWLEHSSIVTFPRLALKSLPI